MLFYKICKPVPWLFYHIFYHLKVYGKKNIPKEEGAIICPNHRSNHDSVIVAVTCPRPIRYMAKIELFKNKIAAFFLKAYGAYPVKRGEADLPAVRKTFKLLKDKQLVGIFPEGTRVKGGDFGKAHPGVAMFSIKTGKPVIPVYIETSYKLFSKIKVVYGEPIDFKSYKKERMTNDDYSELSQMIIDKFKELKRGNF